jgi:hypothetical protein
VLGEVVEVVVEGAAAGDRNLKAVATVVRTDDRKQGIDVAASQDRDQRRVAVGRHERRIPGRVVAPRSIDDARSCAGPHQRRDERLEPRVADRSCRGANDDELVGGGSIGREVGVKEPLSLP